MKNWKKFFSRLLTIIFAIDLGFSLSSVPCFGMPDVSDVEAAYYVNYSSVFDARYYADRYSDLFEAFGYNYESLLNHFIQCGMKEGRVARPDFDVNTYKSRYGDLRKSFGDNLRAYYMHYIYCGKAEGRNGAPIGYVKPEEPDIIQREVSDNEVKAYYDRAVFVGDSLMEGYRNYALLDMDACANQSDFLAVRSYSLVHALKPSTEDELQPVFQGQRLNIWDAIPQMDVDRVFIMFGTNDLVSRDPERIFYDYMALLDKIREQCPDLEFHVISMTPVAAGAGKGLLNRDGVRDLNQLLKINADSYGYDYIDIYSSLADEQGDLPAELCSDGLIHETRAAYENNWDNTLRDYAVQMIWKAEAQGDSISENSLNGSVSKNASDSGQDSSVSENSQEQ